ncbi:MAG: cell surface protein SprA, partial [Bacteroidota bacterium]
VNKTFTWNRTYNLSYDITRSLRLDFNATNRALIEEPTGRVNRSLDLGGDVIRDGEVIEGENLEYSDWRDTVWASIRDFGKNLEYNQSVNLSYQLPLQKFPFLDWISSNARYSATYNWQRAPLATQDSVGNTVTNSNQLTLSGRFNMITLYNKVPYLRKINRNQRSRGRNQRVRQPKPEPEEADSTKKKKIDLKIGENIAKVLMGLKNINVQYSQGHGNTLPGYDPETRVLGMDRQFEAPGLGFVFGQHDNFGPDKLSFAEYAISRNWMDTASNQFLPFIQTSTENLNISATIEPIKDLRIDLNALRQESTNSQEYWRWNDTIREFQVQSPQTTGNYSVSVITWPTAFSSDDDQFMNDAYQEFLDNRQDISSRLAQENANSIGEHATDVGFADGYGAAHQDVLIPAFIAAYTGQGSGDVSLSPFIKIPKPNWRVTYSGLTKLPSLDKFLKTATISHAYRSTYSISQYLTNVNSGARLNDNFVSDLQINSVSIAEQFSPLINLDLTWLNDLQTRVELRRDRSLTLSSANAQLTETSGNEFIIGNGAVNLVIGREADGGDLL